MAPWGNLALFAAAALAPSALYWAALRVPRVVGRLRREPAAPQGLPIERLAADLRRVRAALARVEPGTPQARRAGARQAYDALLAQACAALDVTHRLDVVPEGVDREIERLRVEESLRQAGVVVS
ncbi:hypothetical protein ABZ816_17480 [Actinosynnema sp. NPDC047251]|uniref:Putative membrane protein n=1 Tax=Saccharothrix espanaensis (strain ATCC 51144 / DSM 44229 / JCM 9112 / NBRC 15066 / NRRL 15764) TaxID=1179773 RepID=K0JYA0_SACES|nr:hypothetical protein [Saccharothrix espanaensis]CCH30312.1 putative membrane protein [Saccharothrix espanaensis DSM 44229]